MLFFPDQHLGRNTARAMGIPLEQMPVWDPHQDELGGNTPEAIRGSRVMLWRGHCSVHQMFRPQHVDQFRAKYPGIKILVHPECTMEVVDQADVVGSTGKIIRAVEEAPPGTQVGHRHRAAPGQPPEARASRAGDSLPLAGGLHVRHDVSHRPGRILCWALENLAAGTPVNVIEVGRRNGPLGARGPGADAGR